MDRQNPQPDRPLFLRQGCGGERLLIGENEERGFPRGGPANSASFTHMHVA